MDAAQFALVFFSGIIGMWAACWGVITMVDFFTELI